MADRGNDRIDVFTASGSFVRAFGWGVLNGASELQVCTAASGCQAGLAGDGPGQFTAMTAIAVDEGSHTVYVADNGNDRVQAFTDTGAFLWTVGGGVNETTGADLCTGASGDECGEGTQGAGEGEFNDIAGVAVGPGGVLYVADQVGSSSTSKSRVQKYDSSGNYLGQLLLEVAGGAGNSTGVVVNSLGNIYVGTGGSRGAVREYSPAGECLNCAEEPNNLIDPSFNVSALAIDPDDNVYVADNTQKSAVLRFEPDGTQTLTFYGTLQGRVLSLAYGLDADVYALEQPPQGANRILDIPLPPPGPVVHPGPESLFVDPIGNVRATLHAQINPEGKATTYRFEYVEKAKFDAEGGWSSPSVASTPESGAIGSDFALHKVEQQITGLTPETDYLFRAVATNADSPPGGSPGPDAGFKTEPPLTFGDVFATEVDTDSAILHAEANPLGFPATGYFEYVDEATYQASGFADASKAPTGAPFDFGGGESFLERSTPIDALQPATTYRYRLVAQDNCKPAEPSVVCTFTSPERMLGTFALPSALTGCPNDPFRPEAGAYLADCRGYEMVSPVDKNGVNVEVVFNITGFLTSLDQARPDGGAITFSAYRAFADPEGAPYSVQYMGRRSASGWDVEPIAAPQEGPAVMTYKARQLDSQYKAFTPDLCSGWLLTVTAGPLLAAEAIPGYPNLYRRDNCEAAGAFEATTKLEPPASEPPNLPPRKFFPEMQGVTPSGNALFGINENLTQDAAAQSGACAATATASDEPCVARLYLAQEGQLELVCILPDGTPLAKGCSAGTASLTQPQARQSSVERALSEDGSRVFWSDSEAGPGKLYVRIDGSETKLISDGAAQFWTAATDGSKAIYSLGEQLFSYDVDAGQATPIAGGVRGVAGASEDASRIYFASTEQLAPGAQAGRPNLYLSEEGDIELVATLLGDEAAALQQSPVSRFPSHRTSRVTPDGEQFIFLSKASPTGYDNEDALTGEPAMEVFLYDAAANGGDGQLRCVSCNPSGSRPRGAKVVPPDNIGYWAASWIPGWTTQLYAPRVVSEDGSRVFFNSFDRLNARDTNARQDVYEWELAGAGDCTASDPLYSAPAGGCISLISSGQSPQDSEFVDSSASGDDVFFKTYSSLAGQDPGLLDLYDARVQGGFAAPAPEAPECAGEACQPPAPPAPAPPPPPRSSTFIGPGNPPPVKPRRCPKGKHRAKRKGRVVCVKNRKAGRAGHKRRAGR